MVTVTHFGEAPFALYHSSVGGNLEIFKEQSTTHRRHEFQNSARPATATRPPRTPRSSLIGFVAVSAVVFLAYLCAVSIGKRIAAPPFSRRLAASLGGGECDVPEDSRSAGSATDTPFEGRPAVTADLHAVVEALGAHPEDTGPDSLTGTIAAAPWRTISRTANPQQEVQRRQPHLSGRGKEQRKQEKEAKPVKFTPVGNETQLQSTPPPLDPDIEALIESVLSGVEDAFVEDVWLPGDELVDREADNSTGRMPPPLEYDPELPSEALTLTEETVYVLPSKPSALPCDSEGPKTPAYRGEERRRECFKRKQEEQHKVAREAKKLRLEAPGWETRLPPSPPPLDPEVYSLIESVLQGGVGIFPEELGIIDGEPLNPTTDPSIGSRPPVSELEFTQRDPDRAAEKAAHTLRPMPSILPMHLGKLKEATASEGLFSADTAGSQRQRELSAGVEAVRSGPSGNPTEAIEETPQALTAYAFGAPEEKKPGSSEESVADTWPSSSRVSPALPQLPLEATFSQQSDSTEQPEYGAELPTDENANLHFRWLDQVYPGVPDSVLRMHPFYRHPEHQPTLITRPFDVKLVASPAEIRIKPAKALSRCRAIMKQPSLTPDDVGELLIEAERLCGYAAGGMPVTYRGGQARSAVETLGTVFLILDTLHCIAEVLGDKSMRQLWWPLIVRHIERARFVTKKEYIMYGRYSRNSYLARALHLALEYYRRGIRPPLRMVIGLKETLLCGMDASSKFTATQWNPWREDATRFRLSIQKSLNEGIVNEKLHG